MNWEIRVPILVATMAIMGCSPVLQTRKTRGNSVTYYTAEGGAVIRGGVQSQWSMCAVPPTQGVRQRTGEGDAGIKIDVVESVNVGVGGSGNSTHKTEKLYEQTAASLFMQHGLYRICEMAQNGGLYKIDKDGKLVTVDISGKTIWVIDAAKYQEMIKMVLDATKDLIATESKVADAVVAASNDEITLARVKATEALIRFCEGTPEHALCTAEAVSALLTTPTPPTSVEPIDH